MVDVRAFIGLGQLVGERPHVNQRALSDGNGVIRIVAAGVHFQADEFYFDIAAKNDANPTSSCKTGSSCLAGSCAPDEVDSKDLPAFTKAGVFGSKNADGDIQCFSTVACLASNKIVPASELDLEDCTITLSALEELTGPTGSNGTGELPGAGGSRSDTSISRR